MYMKDKEKLNTLIFYQSSCNELCCVIATKSHVCLEKISAVESLTCITKTFL